MMAVSGSIACLESSSSPSAGPAEKRADYVTFLMTRNAQNGLFCARLLIPPAKNHRAF